MIEYVEQRYCIKFCQKLGDSQTETTRKIQQVFGEDAMGVTQIKEWFNRFKNGRTSAESGKRSGRPQTSRSAAVVETVRNLVMADRRLTVREIAKEVGVSKDSAHAILREDLNMHRVNGVHIKLEENVLNDPIKEDDLPIKKEVIEHVEGTSGDTVRQIVKEELIIDDIHIKSEGNDFNDPDIEEDCTCDDVITGELPPEEQDVTHNASSTEHVLERSSGDQISDNFFSCSHCPKRFTTKNYLLRHSRTHILDKLFSCENCPKRFTRKNDALQHSRTHILDKPFSCDYCPKRFTRKNNVLRHSRTHILDKLFSCNYCPKRFTRKNDALQHSLTHMVFSCSYCQKSFRTKCHLTEHTQTHTLH